MFNKDNKSDKKTALSASGKSSGTGGPTSLDQCWYCGKRREEVPKLIAVGAGAICSECVAAAGKQMGKE